MQLSVMAMTVVRLAVFIEDLWGGGAEIASYYILRHLSDVKDMQVTVYTGKNTSVFHGINVQNVSFLKANSRPELFYKILLNQRKIEEIVSFADVIYIPRLSYPIIPIAKRLGKKVVVHLHDYHPISYSFTILSSEKEEPLNNLRRTILIEYADHGVLKAILCSFLVPLTKIIRKWINLADKIICVSKKQEELLLKHIPEYRGKTTVIYNPPPEISSMVKTPSRKPTLLYVGGSFYVKGFHVLLEALRMLDKTIRSNLRIFLAGNYTLKSVKIVEMLKRNYDLDIKVLGLISNEEILKLHSKTWALIFPSICEEPFPYAVLEAMLSGTLVIASQVGGIPEIISGTCTETLSFEPGSPDILASKIMEVSLMDRENLIERGLSLRRSALMRFNIDRIKKNLVEVFTQLT